MDNVTLKKKLSTYLTTKGYLKNVPDELLFEVLIAWENWTGSTKEFYQSIGFTSAKLAGIVGKAKRLKREGYFGTGDFKEIKLESPEAMNRPSSAGPCQGAEVTWTDGKIIRFSQVDLLLEFLKKAA